MVTVMVGGTGSGRTDSEEGFEDSGILLRILSNTRLPEFFLSTPESG